MRLIAYLYRQSWRLLLFASVMALLSGLSGAALIAIISKGVSGSPLPLTTLSLLFFGFTLLHLITKTSTEISLLHLTQEAIYRMRLELSQKLVATPQKRLQELGKPSLLVLMTKDIDAFSEVFVWLPIGFGNAIIILACFAYLAYLSLTACALVIIFLIIGYILYSLAERRPRQVLIAVRNQLDQVYEHFRNLIEGSRELQLNAQRGHTYINRILSPETRDYHRHFAHGMTGYSLAGNVGAVMFFLLIGVLLFLVPQFVQQTSEVITTTTFILLFLVRPVAELVFSIPVVRHAEISLQRFDQLKQDLASEDASGRVPDLDDTRPFRIGNDWRLELRQLSHRYPSSSDDRQFVLGPIDLSIQPGKILYIIGGNGSGKTTLAMLILGLYQADAGEILLNDLPVTAANIDAYRQHFSAVFADFHLFEHLLDGAANSIDERASHYLEKLGMRHKVKVVDGKFTTLGLSTGQRKRLALVVAYLEDRPIYLFDEWAADQDPVFKQVFYTELLPELKARGKAVIVITHDDAYFHLADELLKLDEPGLR